MRWETALVTGASSGMGREFAVHLARQGTGLVLVARSRDVLEDLAAQLRREQGVEVEVVVADLTVDEDLARVGERLRNGAPLIDLLVNNAGVGTIGPFADLPQERVEDVARLNVLALLSLTHAAAEQMRRRDHGTILNMASLAGYAPVPHFTVYAATKAFVLALTLGLREELRGTGVSVTALAPGFVDTPFAQKAGVRDAPARWLWAEPERVVELALSQAAAGRAVVLPGPVVRVGSAVARITPPSAFARVAGFSGRTVAKNLIAAAARRASAAPGGPAPDEELAPVDRATGSRA